jgi:glycosyltransferase involved in cell wall biosynthesis
VDIFLAKFYQSKINHITGDVHYLCFLLSGKTILTIHDLHTYYVLNGLKKYIYFLIWIWIPIKKADIIVTISYSIKAEIIKLFSIKPSKIRVIYNPLVINSVKKTKPFNSNLPRILHIGTVYRKNLSNHILALRNFKNFHLVIIGYLDNDLKLSLKGQIDNLTLLDNLSNSDIIEQYKLSDLLLFSSTYEGFGLPIIEAQANGIPVVSSNYGAMAEICGGSACLVDPSDVESIFRGLKQVIEDKNYREYLIKEGFKNIKRFDKNKIAKQYLNLYQDLNASDC